MNEMEKGNIPEINSFLSHENEGVRNAVTALLSDPYQLSDNWKVKYKVNARALESLLHKFSLKVDSLAKASRLTKHRLIFVLRVIPNSDVMTGTD